MRQPGQPRYAPGAPLNGKIRARGGNAYVGIRGARYLLPVLTEHGYADVAYTVAARMDYPSWGYWIDELGWAGLGQYSEATSRSRHYHIFGTIVQWLHEDFVGIESRAIIDGITCGDLFVAYRIDEAEVNLVPVFSARWTPGSPYERDDYPIHTYMDVVADPERTRLLLYSVAL